MIPWLDSHPLYGQASHPFRDEIMWPMEFRYFFPNQVRTLCAVGRRVFVDNVVFLSSSNPFLYTDIAADLNHRLWPQGV